MAWTGGAAASHAGDEHGIVPRAEERAGHPVVRVAVCSVGGRVALEPGQVLEVGAARDEEQVDALALQRLGQVCAPLGVVEGHQRTVQPPSTTNSAPVT